MNIQPSNPLDQLPDDESSIKIENAKKAISEQVEINKEGDLEFTAKIRPMYNYMGGSGGKEIITVTVQATNVRYANNQIETDFESDHPVNFGTPGYLLFCRNKESGKPVDITTVNSLLPENSEHLSSVEATEILKELVAKTPNYEQEVLKAQFEEIVDIYLPIEILRNDLFGTPDYSLKLVNKRQRVYDQMHLWANKLGLSEQEIAEHIADNLLYGEMHLRGDVLPVLVETTGYDLEGTPGETISHQS